MGSKLKKILKKIPAPISTHPSISRPASNWLAPNIINGNCTPSPIWELLVCCWLYVRAVFFACCNTSYIYFVFDIQNPVVLVIYSFILFV